MKLNKKQTQAIDYLEDDVTTELLFGGAAGGGKSMLGSYWQLKRRLKYPGTRGLMGRANLKTLKETTLQSFFEVCKMQGVEADKHFKFNQQSSSINFYNGSQILLKDLFLYPSDPNFDELGSLEITDAFIDECNQTVEKAWNVVKSRIRYKLDEFNLIPKMLGTCNPAKNYVYEWFYKPSKDGTLPENRKFIQALVTDNPDISRHYITNLQSLDEVSKQRLLYANWEYDNDPATLIPYDKILAAFQSRGFESVLFQPDYMSVDVARFGRDKTVIGLWMGCWVKFKTFKGLDVPEVAAEVNKLREQYSIPLLNIIVDEDGVGGGVVDIVRCKGFVNNSTALPNPDKPIKDEKGNVKPDNFANLKSQCYYKLAEYMNNEAIYIDCNDIQVKEMIIQELEQVKQYEMDKDRKRAVMPKDKVKELIGRSPDYSDTLMMRMYFELTKKKKLLWA